MRSEDSVRLLKCIDLIYESVIDHATWPNAIRAITDLLSGNGALHAVFDTPSCTVERAAVVDIPQEALQLYAALSQLDRRCPEAGRLSAGAIYNDCRMTDRAAFERSELFNLVLKPYDVPNHLCAVLQSSPSQFEVVAIQRSAITGPGSGTDEDLLRYLTPHLIRSAKLQQIVNEREARLSLLLEASDRLPFAMAFLDKHGRVIQTSGAMSSLLRAADGILHKRGRLVALRKEDDKHLQCAIGLGNRLTQFEGDTFLIHRDSNRVPLTVSVIRIPEHATRDSNVRMLLFVHNSNQHSHSATARVLRSYQLSDAETRLAMLVTEGLSLRESAARLEVSLNTCKTQLKAIYRKTNSRNRAELMRVIMT